MQLYRCKISLEEKISLILENCDFYGTFMLKAHGKGRGERIAPHPKLSGKREKEPRGLI